VRGPCYIVRRGKATHLQNLVPKASIAALLTLSALSAAPGQNLPVMVGQPYDAAAAALKAKAIAFQEEPAGAGKRIVYKAGTETVTLDFSMWPKDPKAPASAWAPGQTAGKQLVLTQILDVSPGSDARRAWVRTFEKEGRRWGYMSAEGQAERAAADREKYPVAAVLQWPGTADSAPVTFLFEAARPAGAPPGNEATALSISLDNPHKPRRF